MKDEQPHIAYLTASDPNDKRSWSGIHHFAIKALETHCGKVTPLGPYHPSALISYGRAFSLASRKISGKRFDYNHSERLAKAYGKYFSQKLKEGNYDLVVAVAASTELASLQTDLPVYYIADATFAGMIDYYDFYRNLLPRSIREGNAIQERALKKARQLFFSSEWAAQSAIRDYSISPGRVQVVPFGANLEETPGEISAASGTAECRLLFMGVEWERKGGPIAFDTMKRLRQKGIDAKLSVVGCTPPVSDEHLTVVPFLNKNDAAQRKELYRLIAASDFLVLPTRAECFGLVFCEASAFGVPSLATDTGGVSGAVKNGVNGFLFPPEANGAAYAEKIEMLITDKAKLNELRKSARQLYESELNWDAWGKKVSGFILEDYRKK